jgi:glycosyltransferase involved in cell wall biosynthesis
MSSGSGRVGFDVRLTYYTRGGIARYIHHLARDLPILDAERLYTHFYRRGHAETFSERARRVDCWTPSHHWLESVALSFELGPHRLDLLHSPDFIPPLWGYQRSIITVHDLTFLRHPEFLTDESRRYYNGQIHRAVRLTDAILADSYATKADLVNLLSLPPERITVVHLGLDEEFRPSAEDAVPEGLTRLNLSPGYILFVGTFEPRKNVPGLFGAYFRLRKLMPDAPPLVLVGNKGWLFEATASLMHDLGLEQHVRFFENLPSQDLVTLYQHAGLFTLISHYEGFGFPVLEAMACGVPTIISDRASLPEIGGEAALKVDPGDPDAIADALQRALTDSALRQTMRQKGLEQAKKFSWEKTARETLELYNRVLEM